VNRHYTSLLLTLWQPKLGLNAIAKAHARIVSKDQTLAPVHMPQYHPKTEVNQTGAPATNRRQMICKVESTDWRAWYYL